MDCRFSKRPDRPCFVCSLGVIRRLRENCPYRRLMEAVQKHIARLFPCDAPDDYEITSGSCAVCDKNDLCAAAKGLDMLKKAAEPLATERKEQPCSKPVSET